MVLVKCLSTSPLKTRGEKHKPAGWTAKKDWEGQGKGMGFRVGWGCSFSGQGQGFGAGVFRFGVSGVKVQGKGFRRNGSGFGDE